MSLRTMQVFVLMIISLFHFYAGKLLTKLDQSIIFCFFQCTLPSFDLKLVRFSKNIQIGRFMQIGFGKWSEQINFSNSNFRNSLFKLKFCVNFANLNLENPPKSSNWFSQMGFTISNRFFFVSITNQFSLVLFECVQSGKLIAKAAHAYLKYSPF